MLRQGGDDSPSTSQAAHAAAGSACGADGILQEQPGERSALTPVSHAECCAQRKSYEPALIWRGLVCVLRLRPHWLAVVSKEAVRAWLFSVRLSHSTPWTACYFKTEHFYIQKEEKMCSRHRSRRDGLLMGRGSTEPESHFAISCPFFLILFSA